MRLSYIRGKCSGMQKSRGTYGGKCPGGNVCLPARLGNGRETDI